MEFYLILILYLITLFVIYKLASRFIDVELQKNKIKSDELIKDTKIDNTALDVLDSLINDVLEEYTVFEIKTKNIDYINNKLEDKIRDYLTEEIPKRISILLMKKLEYMYNSEYIGELIGKRIYMIVTDYTNYKKINYLNKRIGNYPYPIYVL